MEAGQQRQVARRFRTLEEARRWKAEQENLRHHGIKPRPVVKRSLNEHLDQWLSGLDVAARTRVDYENVVKRYWREPLGHYRLDQITTDDVVRVLGEMSAKGLSPRTRQQARTVLRIALGEAVERGLIGANPATGSRRLRIRQERRPMSVLTGAQVNALLDGTTEDRLGALWHVLLGTGVRLGEALGLNWGDVDFDRAELHVVRALVRPTHGVDWLLETPKSGRTRVVPLMTSTAAALQRHRDRQAVERLVAGEGYAGHGFVFADERGEPLQGTVVYKYHWQPMLRRLSLPAIRLHDCRHTAATVMHQAGYDMQTVQRTLGHATIAITMDVYSHLMPEHQRRQTQRLEEHLRRARTTKGQPGESE